jgi:hypothetical protein
VASVVPNSEATQFKAGAEQVEIARQGGIASGKARREKATMKQVLEDMLQDTNNTGLTYQQLATLGLIQGAVKGNAQNYKTIIEMLGEVPKEQFIETKEPILNINITGSEELKEEFFKEENNG